MSFKTHNDQYININNTCLQGYIQARRSDLEIVFGIPAEYDPASKITTTWEIMFDTGEVATIYDWKRYAPVGYNEVIDWHIGSIERSTVEKVHAAFRAGHGLKAAA